MEIQSTGIHLAAAIAGSIVGGIVFFLILGAVLVVSRRRRRRRAAQAYAYAREAIPTQVVFQGPPIEMHAQKVAMETSTAQWREPVTMMPVPIPMLDSEGPNLNGQVDGEENGSVVPPPAYKGRVGEM